MSREVKATITSAMAFPNRLGTSRTFVSFYVAEVDSAVWQPGTEITIVIPEGTPAVLSATPTGDTQHAGI